MGFIKLDIKSLKPDLDYLAINGQFFPGQMSSRLYMRTEDVAKKYQTAFHERFYYLQYIFTPYGHMKWGANRTFSSEILNIWLDKDLSTRKKFPVSEYLENNENSLKVLCSIMMQDFTKRLSDVTEGIVLTREELKIVGVDDEESLIPQIEVSGKRYSLNGLDIIESFAKYEEAIIALLVDLKNNKLKYNIFEDNSFWEYTTLILTGCQFEEWDEIWKSAEEYAKQCDLSMSQEMLLVINYKKGHPWCLSYPMANAEEFIGAEFNRFYPLFTITDNEVFYNVAGVNQNEIFLENEIQSFVSQLIGYKSKYNLYPHSIQCADSYYGIHSCKHWLDGTCDGHLCAESEIPELVMDDNYNIIDGCMLEIFLNIEGTSIKKIEIGNTGKVLPFSELASLVKTVRADTTKTQ